MVQSLTSGGKIVEQEGRLEPYAQRKLKTEKKGEATVSSWTLEIFNPLDGTTVAQQRGL